ncbi:MAG TPA: hypothetical protein DCS55_08430 [Acidimicrobiaceae bacterium]|nr:hypothetical protein [Acidimicrobiaceae bacterium]
MHGSVVAGAELVGGDDVVEAAGAAVVEVDPAPTGASSVPHPARPASSTTASAGAHIRPIRRMPV